MYVSAAELYTGVLGDLRGVSQSTVSRIVTTIVPIIKTVLAEFVPNAQDAIAMVKGRAVLVDGTITPCWSYAEHPELWSRKKGTTGFNAQLLSLLDGNLSTFLSPSPARLTTPPPTSKTIEEIVREPGGAIADKGGFAGHSPSTEHDLGTGGVRVSRRDDR